MLCVWVFFLPSWRWWLLATAAVASKSSTLQHILVSFFVWFLLKSKCFRDSTFCYFSFSYSVKAVKLFWFFGKFFFPRFTLRNWSSFLRLESNRSVPLRAGAFYSSPFLLCFSCCACPCAATVMLASRLCRTLAGQLSSSCRASLLAGGGGSGKIITSLAQLPATAISGGGRSR